MATNEVYKYLNALYEVDHPEITLAGVGGKNSDETPSSCQNLDSVQISEATSFPIESSQNGKLQDSTVPAATRNSFKVDWTRVGRAHLSFPLLPT
ncbi:hypothetical protein ElyMa_000617200 [Elysia marginata]|uniref:Uncharacterized protein n=1 Tax=Elysia marginata TaxID=1093978 RepID=A0AAV4G8A4_9GAST|nr:hypothetical protein ElyMa_000617200 [Elysia marginata]